MIGRLLCVNRHGQKDGQTEVRSLFSLLAQLTLKNGGHAVKRGNSVVLYSLGGMGKGWCWNVERRPIVEHPREWSLNVYIDGHHTITQLTFLNQFLIFLLSKSSVPTAGMQSDGNHGGQ
jgi:hypothetical protein